MTDKNVNYTDEMTAKMAKVFADGTNSVVENIETIMGFTGKSKRSVIAKLSNMGVYKAIPRTTKTGAPVITKANLVAKIAVKVGVDLGELETMSKATKADLNTLLKALG